MKAETEKKINEILDSFEGIEQVQAPDFFYTRLRSRMEKRSINPAEGIRLKYSFLVMGALILLIALHTLVLFGPLNPHSPVHKKSGIEAFAETYNIIDSKQGPAVKTNFP